MASELEDDTVVRPRLVAPPVDDDLDADTVIRARTPFADVPLEALELVAEPVAQPEPAPVVADVTETQPFDYTFRVNIEEPVGLDIAAIVGRRPSLPRITGRRVPRLVRVSSPHREVSASHLELRQHGALVVLTDLHSTNGSFVRSPGRPPVKLQQGETLVVVPGTTIDIGDDNIIEILPLQRVDADQSNGDRE